MTTTTYPVSAKIYQFPAPSRRAASGVRERYGAASEAASDGRYDAALEHCWYHALAVEQSADSTKLRGS
jgi:hypothetical protein